jgi:hypothetical protein
LQFICRHTLNILVDLANQSHTSGKEALAKVDLLKGSLHIETKSCGKPNCRCVCGYLHGPFFYRRFRQDGQQRKQYVRRENVADVLDAIARRQALDREVVDIRKQLLWSIET